MSVLLETSLGDIVIDLHVDACPKTCHNFLKLCKIYYYTLNSFFNVSKDFLAQAGDPTATGTGGECISSLIASQAGTHDVPRYFAPEILPRLKHTEKGTVSMAVAPSVEGQPSGGCGSQFFITLSEGIEYLDGKHAVFGRVVEGLDTLDKINGVFVDRDGRPFKDIRIRHVVVLEDPFPDPPGLVVPESPPTRPQDNSTRIAEDEDPLEELPEDEAEKQRREQAAAASALTLEMVGDLPFANVRPPENVLFVCKLNPVTRDEDLELIFSRFGPIMSCQVIRDKKTGDSLQYAFIEFDKRADAEQAYFKMQNVLVDDRRIWVDFSQSVSRVNGSWSNNPVRDNQGGQRGKARGPGGGGFGGRDDLEETRRVHPEGILTATNEGLADVQGRDLLTTTENAGDVVAEMESRLVIEGAKAHTTVSLCAQNVAVGRVMQCIARFARFLSHSFLYVHYSFVWPGPQARVKCTKDPIFGSSDADIILRSDDARPTDFRVHRCILRAGSPFFQTMFSLPQPECDTPERLPVLDVSEPAAVLDPLLRFLYPVPDPDVSTLDALVLITSAASKYDMAAVTDRLRVLLVSPAFLATAPVRVFAIASRFDFEEEAKLASSHTLRVHVLDAPLCEDLRHISAYAYHRLLELHRQRGDAAREALCVRAPDGLRCAQCNGAQYNAVAPPKWWGEFVARAGEELRSRPTSDVVFSLRFLVECAHAAGCARCTGSILESYVFLDTLKAKIDALPSTI